MGKWRGAKGPVNVLFGWVRRQSVRVKVFLGAVAAILAVVALKRFVHDVEHFFIASESVHAAGIMVLIYKLTTKRTCSGLSLKSQEFTAIFLAARLCCSFILEFDIHTVLDFATLIPTLWVIYMIRFRLKSSYIKELDSTPRYYVVVPCAVLAIFIHPLLKSNRVIGIIWAFCVFLESVSVFPQLRLMQNAKLVEPFTAHYVFALGVSRFLGCAQWIIQLIETRGFFLADMGSSMFWFPSLLLAEMVQTFILADFCYYYVTNSVFGPLLPRLPSSA